MGEEALVWGQGGARICDAPFQSPLPGLFPMLCSLVEASSFSQVCCVNNLARQSMEILKG